MIFDTHAHYDDNKFNEDRDELLSTFQQNNICSVMNVSSSMDTIEPTIELTKKYPFFYGALGVHPSDTSELTENDMSVILSKLSLPKICAVGEIGLDYYWNEPEPSIQKHWFERQIDLARQSSLPMIIHSRDAAKDTLDIMKAEHTENIGGVIHCFSYSKEIAREYLNMGFYFGIGGVVTFSNSKKLKEVVEYLPIENIVLETDCPYLAPVPFRGKRNSSLNIPYIVQEIACIKNISAEDVETVTYQNALNLYHLNHECK